MKRKKAKKKSDKFGLETRSVYLRVDADEQQRFDPPKRMLQVSVVDDFAFIGLVKLTETYDETHYQLIGDYACVDVESLISALGYDPK